MSLCSHLEKAAINHYKTKRKKNQTSSCKSQEEPEMHKDKWSILSR
jgi:hypothetical protein